MDAAQRYIFQGAPLAAAVGPGVKVLAEIPQGIVAVRQGRHMALSFHPEISGDLRLHRLFLERLRP